MVLIDASTKCHIFIYYQLEIKIFKVISIVKSPLSKLSD